jgi:16S rRNA (cytidine1402-2'-O)-methyltransferase
MEKEAPHTLIFFESPHRVGILLADALEILGNRLAAVCMDLTKMHENVCKGYLQDLVKIFAKKGTKGEITVIIAGNNPKFRNG